jgi:hypothetical protein
MLLQSRTSSKERVYELSRDMIDTLTSHVERHQDSLVGEVLDAVADVAGFVLVTMTIDPNEELEEHYVLLRDAIRNWQRVAAN